MRKSWGAHINGEAFLYCLSNDTVEVWISNYGAIIQSILAPDRHGNKYNVVLGYQNLQDYVSDEYYLGCVVGRVAGRISTAGFTIDNQRYELSPNSGEAVHLHGGYEGFGKKLFKTLEFSESMLRLHHFSAHLDEGYPGNLDVWITYELTPASELIIKYRAICDRDTHINLTSHSYFNLNGSRDINHHEVRIDADAIIATDDSFIPSGGVLLVMNSRFDFNEQREVGRQASNECFVLRDGGGAFLYEPESGRSVSVQTDCPGLLLYTGDYLAGKFSEREGLCLETQFFPDSANQPDFPSTLLRAGEEWERQTIFRFGTM